MLWSLVGEKSVTLVSCFNFSHFAFCLQKIPGRPSPVLAHVKTAVQKVTDTRNCFCIFAISSLAVRLSA